MARTAPGLLSVIIQALCALGASAAVSVGADHTNSDKLADKLRAAQSAMSSDIPTALKMANSASAEIDAQPDSKAKRRAAATAAWLKAEALCRLNRCEEAAPVANSALAAISEIEPNSKLQGDLTLVLGRIALSQGHYGDALVNDQKAYKIYQNLNNFRQESIALAEISFLYFEAQDYKRAFDYDNMASEIYADDPAFTVDLENNSALTLRNMGNISGSSKRLFKALEMSKRLKNKTLTAFILNNIAVNQIMQHRLDDASVSIAQAQSLIQGDPNSSKEQATLYGAAAKVAFERHKIELAQQLIEKAFANKELDDHSEAATYFHRTAYEIYKSAGDSAKALKHLEIYERLSAEALKLAASANASLATAQFDFANQDLKIAKLKAGQLERDVKLAQTRLNAVIGGMVAAVLLLGALTAFLFTLLRSRKALAVAHNRLELSNTFLEKALKAKTEFLATVSHELRTPLNGILGMIQVVIADTDVDASVKSKMQVAQDAGDAMTTLIDDILDSAQLESGRLSISEGPMDLKAMIRGVAKFWTVGATAKGLTLDIRMGDVPTLVIADERRLQQILFNLVSNALKFTDKGGVTLTVDVEASAAGDQLVFQVEDTGIGIPSDKLDDIFGTFQQLDGGVTRHYGGSGLGLSICKGLCNLMTAEISVESALGVGSCFRVRLPLVLADEPDVAVNTPAQALSGIEKAHLLVIETNPMAQSLLRVALQPDVAAITVTGNITDGQSLARSGRFHIVIFAFDGGAAHEAALEVMSALCPVIVLTTPDHADIAARVPSCRVLVRPTQISALKDQLATAFHDWSGDRGAQSLADAV